MRTTKLNNKLNFKCILLDVISKYSAILFVLECNVRVYYRDANFKFRKYYEKL